MFSIQLEAAIFIRLPLHSGLVTPSRKFLKSPSCFSVSVFHSDDILFDITEGKLVSNSHWHRLESSLLKYTLKEDGPTGDLNLRIKVEITPIQSKLHLKKRSQTFEFNPRKEVQLNLKEKQS